VGVGWLAMDTGLRRHDGVLDKNYVL